MELASLSFTELLALRNQIDQLIKLREKEEKAVGKKKILELARQYGLSLDELSNGEISRTRAPVAPKFANPANPSQTWTGRGRQPLWMAQALAEGKTFEDLAI